MPGAMRRTFVAALTLMASLAPATAAQAALTLSTSDRLDDRRYVARHARLRDGQRGRPLPGVGLAHPGEMGGVWTPPLKLLDGIWFGSTASGSAPPRASQRLRLHADGPARAAGSADAHRLRPGRLARGARRPDAPLTGGPQAVDLPGRRPLRADVRLPVGVDDAAARHVQPPRHRGLDGRRLVSASRHAPCERRAACGPRGQPLDTATGPGVPRPAAAAGGVPGDRAAPPSTATTAPPAGAPAAACVRADVPRGGSRTLWVAVAGSDAGPPAAQRRARPRWGPGGRAPRQGGGAGGGAARTVDLPGDPLLQRSVEWSKQNLADSVQEARGARAARDRRGQGLPATDGRARPGALPRRRLPRLPVGVRHGRRVHRLRQVAAGQFGPIKDHLRALRDVSGTSTAAAARSCTRYVRTAACTSDAEPAPGTPTRPRSSRAPSRSCGAGRATAASATSLYDFAGAACSTGRAARRRRRRLAGGARQRRAGRHGRGEARQHRLDDPRPATTSPTWRARRRHGHRSAGPAARAAMEAAFEGAWWSPAPQYADSLDDPGDVQGPQRHWIGVTPMETELCPDGAGAGAHRARARRRGARPARAPATRGEFGLFHTGCDGGPRAE